MNILWIPHAGWHIPQRAHLFCRALAERHEVHVTDWVADFSSPRDLVSRHYLQNFTYRHYRDSKIIIHGIPRISPALFLSSLRRLNTKIFSYYVQQIIEQAHVDVVVGTFVVPPPKVPRLVFDLFDDNVDYWLSYKNRPDYAREIEQIERAYIQQSDEVVAVSSVLCDHVRKLRQPPKNNPPHLIPNGVKLAEFRRENGHRIREELGLANFKVIGLISALGEFTGLLRLIDAFHYLNDPEAALLIVGDGPQLEPARKRAKQVNLSKVVFTGQVPFSRVAEYYKAINVGVIPFDKTRFTDAACPIKLLEYSAAGKLVVSTDLAEVCQMSLPNVILAKPTTESLLQGLKNALITSTFKIPTLEEYDVDFLVKRYETVLIG